MKKVLWLVLTILVLALSIFKIYIMVMPEVMVTNSSGVNVNVVTIELPKNRIVFDNILHGESSTIYYSLDQADGAYKYTILFETGEIINDECGYLTQNEIGKIFRIEIVNTTEVMCDG